MSYYNIRHVCMTCMYAAELFTTNDLFRCYFASLGLSVYPQRMGRDGGEEERRDGKEKELLSY